MKKVLSIALCLGFLSACKKNPIDRLSNPVPNGAVPQSSGVFVIYDDELNTGGGLAFIPNDQNQSIDLHDQSSPIGNVCQIRYTWNGGDTNSQHLFAGFQLIVTPSGSTLASAPAKNLTVPAYTKLTLRVRGILPSGYKLRIEGPNDNSGTMTSARTEIDASNINNQWQLVTLPVPAGDFSSVKIFMTLSLQYTQPPRTTVPGDGGVIFVDDIHYER